jgi:hypothetical protein
MEGAAGDAGASGENESTPQVVDSEYPDGPPAIVVDSDLGEPTSGVASTACDPVAVPPVVVDAPISSNPIVAPPVISPIPTGPRASDSEPDLETFAGVLKWIFVGKRGIRAGWSVLAFAAIYFVTLLSGVLGMMILRVPLNFSNGDIDLPKAFGLQVLELIPLAVATVAMSFVERRSPFAYGLKGPKMLRRLFWGFGVGLAAMSGLVLTLASFHLVAIEGMNLAGWPAIFFGIIWALHFLLLGVVEENTFRGYLQFTLARGMGFWWGAILLGILFGLAHMPNAGESWIGLASVVAWGLMASFSLKLTGSLWWAIGCHAAWDWLQSYVFGVADSGMMISGHLFNSHPTGNGVWSGGATGPEGSLLVFPCLALISLGLWLAFGRKNPALSVAAQS